MKSLFYSYDMEVDKAYIIRIKDNQLSNTHAKRCSDSCDQVGMPYEFWDAYDGTVDKIVPPHHHNDTMKIIKVTDHYMTRGEVACALSHISLWVKCAVDDKPLVILEHDAIMLARYKQHAVFNSICYLGGHEQVKEGWAVLPTPPHASDGPNYHFIGRAHAYAIDPAVAKNMVSHVLKFGICSPLDIMIRSDIFPMHQWGVYAYDAYVDKDKTKYTTIFNRPAQGRTTKRNDELKS